ncbi:putative protein phosphatase 2C 73 [Tasmannia lanceolata]|uniref:putative protein phosphatase 2C 73 n=1 Tax=Tasmannia lanceolata TaxID=3420 RepID=UPI00406289A3
MGACCSKEEKGEGYEEDEEEKFDDDEKAREGEGGARVRLQGFYKFASMFTQQGKKGINQDAMTIWEDFNGEKDKIYCGVFDGHGPQGHKVAAHVRDVLPSKLSQKLKPSKPNDSDDSDDNEDFDSDDNNVDADSHHPSFSSWKAGFVKAFKEMDEELGQHSTIDCYCSGATAVSILKQGEHLTIANLGDSRAILCTRDDKNQPIPVQLTVDLKPNLPSEAERIISCKGRVFALEQEPDVYRMWLPEDDCPGLAMARAFGDFCLKDFGLSSIPQVSYRKITDKDEFVVLATDGVWDVLSNKDVIKIVSSARKRSMAAKLLVHHATHAWKCKYPTSKIDDCAAICLFLKFPSISPNPMSELTEADMKCREPLFSESTGSDGGSQRFGTTTAEDAWNALDGVSRVNSIVKLPRFSTIRT